MFEVYNRHVYDLAVQRHRCLLLIAQGNRLIKKALSGRVTHHRFYSRTLARLGRQLVVWGWRLQERYGAATPNLTTR